MNQQPFRNHVPGLTDARKQVNVETRWPHKVYEIKGWGMWGDRRKLRELRRIAEEFGRDPRLREFTINSVLRPAGVQARDWPGMARAIHAWVRDNIFYVNEPGELVQSPWFTIKKRFADCDDMAVLMAAMAESIALPWRFAIAGKGLGGRHVRYTEGGRMPWSASFAHIYIQFGWPPGRPTTWVSAEPTMKNAPFGYDVVEHGLAVSPAGQVSMPELAGWQGSGFGNAKALATQPGIEVVNHQRPSLVSRLDWDAIIQGAIQGVIVSATVAILVPLLMRRAKAGNGAVRRWRRRNRRQ